VNTKVFGCQKRAGAVGSRGDSSGFTLIELLTVVSIVAILAASSSGAFQRFIVSARISEGSSNLRSALELARSEAAMRGVRVGVCRSIDANENGATCSQAAAGNIGGNDWSAGWIVYAKTPPNAGDTFENGDILIRRQASLSSAGLSSRLMIWAPGAGAIVYNWNGMRVAGPAGNFAFDFGPAVSALPVPMTSDLARCMAVNIAGRIDVTQPHSGSCQP
jgi:prepilin-type N-terminal cleavage/methylation domain-containing protein